MEKKHEALLSQGKFILRMINHGLAAVGVVVISLVLGVAGYHYFEHLSWLDSLLNASMILGGMGPVNPVVTTAGKVFASAYALFSGMIFLVAVGVLLAPAFHRFLHRFHLDEGSDDKGE